MREIIKFAFDLLGKCQTSTEFASADLNFFRVTHDLLKNSRGDAIGVINEIRLLSEVQSKIKIVLR